MKKKYLFIAAALIVSLSFVGLAQQSSPPPPEYGWKHGLVSSLTLSQIAFTDWAQGGENALAYTFTVDGKSNSDREVSNWTTLYKFAFGQTRLGNQGLRKTDDIIDFSTVFTYKLGSFINPYVSASLKTQFAPGYTYPRQDSSVQQSAFFDPAFLIQTVGAGYQPIKEIKTRLGVGVREVITHTYNQYTDDPATTNEVEKTTVNGGIESVTDVDWQIDENIKFTTQFEFFAPVKHFDEFVIRDNSTLTTKVSKYITAVFSVQLINESRVSPRTQVKETIAMGLSYTIF